MGTTSINIQPIKGGSEIHNKREKELSYVRSELSHKNESWEIGSVSNRTAAVKENYKQNVGQKMQKKATPIREGVVVINQNTSMPQLQELARRYEDRFGIKTFQIHIHKDEGHSKAKDWKPNLHAHMVFDWTDEKGKSLKLNRQDMAEMQTMTAEVLGMERGKSSDRKHETAQQYKLSVQKKELQKAIKELQSDLKKYQVGKVAKSTLFKTIERTKDLMGISTNDKEKIDLRAKNEALEAKMERTEEKYQELDKKLSGLRSDLMNKDWQLSKTRESKKELEAFEKEAIAFANSVKPLLFNDKLSNEKKKNNEQIIKRNYPKIHREMNLDQGQKKSRGIGR